jgi:hypothetical protein
MQPCNEQIKRLTKQQKFQRLELANSHVHVVEDVDLSNLEQQHFRLRECLAQSLRFNKTLQISPGSFQLVSSTLRLHLTYILSTRQERW